MANVEDQLNKSLDQLIKEHGGDRRGGGRVRGQALKGGGEASGMLMLMQRIDLPRVRAVEGVVGAIFEAVEGHSRAVADTFTMRGGSTAHKVSLATIFDGITSFQHEFPAFHMTVPSRVCRAVTVGMERRDGVDLVYGWGLDEAGIEKFTVRCLHTDLLEVGWLESFPKASY